MLDYTEEYRQKFNILRQIEVKYELPVKELDDIISSIDTYRVTTPIVGNFSTGKSSMINALVGKQIVNVEITPETAVPTEVYYGNNRVFRETKEGIVEYGIEDLPLKDLNIRNTELVRIEYNQDFLWEIKSVSIVDLPGFDTSIELHNKAIDQYLPNSLAYLLVVASDEPVLKDSMISLLKELKQHEMPVYVAITKCSRLTEQEINDCKRLIGKLVSDILGENVRIACVDSYGGVRIDEIKDIFREIQTRTGAIFEKKYSSLLNYSARYVDTYLTDRIDKAGLTTSQLEQEQEHLEKKIRELSNKIRKEMNNFDAQANVCLETIKNRVQSDLEANKQSISVLLENKMDITEKVNSVVREAVMFGIKTEFEPKLQKYVEKVAELISIDFPKNDVNILHAEKYYEEKIAVGIGKTAIPVLLAAVGGFLINPVAAAVAGVIGLVSETIHNITSSRKRKKEIDKAAANIASSVSKQAAESIEGEIRNYIKGVNEVIERDVKQQTRALEKSLADIKKDIQIEEGSRELELADIRQDLNTVRGFIV